MYAVATEEGPLTAEQERRILLQLTSRVGLGPDLAQTCLAGGKRLARKRDIIDMLRLIAGPSAHRIGSVRESLGRLSSSLLRG
jgi:hypothetical protein